MKREDLKALELTDEAIDTIMALHGKDVEKSKADLATAQADNKALKTQLGEANTTIEGFKALDIEGVKKAADEWKTKAEQAEANVTKQLDALKFDHALDAALRTAKAKNPATVRALLQLDDLKLVEDGTIKHLEDQLKTVRESNAFLFNDEDNAPPPRIVAGAHSTTAADPLWASMLKGAGLTDSKT